MGLDVLQQWILGLREGNDGAFQARAQSLSAKVVGTVSVWELRPQAGRVSPGVLAGSVYGTPRRLPAPTPHASLNTNASPAWPLTRHAGVRHPAVRQGAAGTSFLFSDKAALGPLS